MTERKERTENRRWNEVTLPNQEYVFYYLFSDNLDFVLREVDRIRESKPPVMPNIRELSGEEAATLKKIIKNSSDISYRKAVRKGIRGTIIKNGFPVSVGNLNRKRLSKVF